MSGPYVRWTKPLLNSEFNLTRVYGPVINMTGWRGVEMPKGLLWKTVEVSTTWETSLRLFPYPRKTNVLKFVFPVWGDAHEFYETVSGALLEKDREFLAYTHNKSNIDE